MYADFACDQRYLDSFAGTLILGVAGTNGAGKDSLMDLLQAAGFLVYNTSHHLGEVSQAVMGSIARGGNDSPIGSIGNAQRRRWPGGTVELGLIDWWARAGHLPKGLRPRGLVIGSIRGTGELARLHQVGGRLIAVDADVHVRYDRIYRRQRPDEAGVSFDDFVLNEQNELAAGQTDPEVFGMAAVLEQADIYLYNNGPLDDFDANAADVLKDNGIIL